MPYQPPRHLASIRPADSGLEPAIAIRGIKLLNQGRGGTLGPFIELTYLPDLSQEPRRVEVHLVLGKVYRFEIYTARAQRLL